MEGHQGIIEERRCFVSGFNPVKYKEHAFSPREFNISTH